MMRRAASIAFAAAGALVLGACANAPLREAAAASAPAACARGQQPMRAELLYFGSAMPEGTVSPEEWRGFVDEVVTPRFPDGLTTWPASGQWKAPGGAPVREASWVLDIVHAPDAQSDAAIAAIVQAYKKRFHQESVLRVSSDACVAF